MPAIVDVPSGKVVTNDFAQITLDFETEWGNHFRDGAPDLYPQASRAEIDDVNDKVFTDINPTGIAPVGPDASSRLALHHREQFGGRPFGDGTPSGPPIAGEVVPKGHEAGV